MYGRTAITTLPMYLEAVFNVAREFKAAVADAKDVEAPWFRGSKDAYLDLLPGAYWRSGVDETALLIEFKDQAPPYFDTASERSSMPSLPWHDCLVTRPYHC
jgi:hypothetical protein